MLGGSRNREEVARAFSMASAGVEMVVPALIGRYIDMHYGTEPWGVLIGGVLGFTVSIIHIVKLSQQQDKAAKSAPTKKDEPAA